MKAGTNNSYMNGEIDPHKYSGPLEDLEKQKRGSSVRIPLITAVIVLIAGIGVFFLVREAEGGFIGSDVSFIPFIAIWPAIIIPIIASQKKKNQQGAPMNADQKRIVAFVIAGIALVIAMAVGLFVFLAEM